MCGLFLAWKALKIVLPGLIFAFTNLSNEIHITEDYLTKFVLIFFVKLLIVIYTVLLK